MYHLEIIQTIKNISKIFRKYVFLFEWASSALEELHPSWCHKQKQILESHLWIVRFNLDFVKRSPKGNKSHKTFHWGEGVGGKQKERKGK